MSCSKTFATLRLFHEDLDPDRVSRLLGVQPTKGHRRDDLRPGGASPYRTGMWSLSTEDLGSLDIREHLDHLLDVAEPRADALAQLRLAGTRQDVFCYWATTDGQGGPALDPEQMGRLANLGLAISFDCYVLKPDR